MLKENEIRNPTFSLCMIVKNEEAHLKTCLESAKDHVDEIIIVDTGSTDRTVEIARKYTDKVYHHPWENSFSKARNISLKHATCDWILILDADCELCKDDAHKLREVINDDVNAIYLPCISKINNGRDVVIGNTLLMFRNHLGFHYEGIVHNDLKFSGKTSKENIKIYHHGYAKEEELERKFIRTSKLLKEQIRNNPEDPKPHQYLATSYIIRNKYDECIEEALKAINLYERVDKDSQLLLLTYYTISVAYRNKNDLEHAEEYSLKAVKLCPDYLDPYAILSIVYFLNKDYAKFFHYTEEYLKLLSNIKKDPSNILEIPYNTINDEWFAYSRMSIVHYEQGNDKKGLLSLKRAVDSTDAPWKPYLAIGKHFMEHNNLTMAERFLKDGLKHDQENREIQSYLADTYEKNGSSDKALTILRKILQNHADEIPAQYRLGLLLARNNQYNEAISSFKSVINRETKHTGALFNLAVSYEMVGNIAQAKETYNNLLKIKPEHPEVLVRLGAMYLNEPDYIKAKECFLNTVKLDKYLIEAHLALSKIYLALDDLESCVMSCDELLRCLDLPRDITINSASDLSKLYINIGEILKAQKKELLANMSLEIASLIDPVVTDKNNSSETHSLKCQ